MKYGIYAIFDAVSGVFTAPTIDLADSAAARIGDFDVETGAIKPLAPVMCVLRGSDVKGDDNV